MGKESVQARAEPPVRTVGHHELEVDAEDGVEVELDKRPLGDDLRDGMRFTLGAGEPYGEVVELVEPCFFVERALSVGCFRLALRTSIWTAPVTAFGSPPVSHRI